MTEQILTFIPYRICFDYNNNQCNRKNCNYRHCKVICHDYFVFGICNYLYHTESHYKLQDVTLGQLRKLFVEQQRPGFFNMLQKYYIGVPYTIINKVTNNINNFTHHTNIDSGWNNTTSNHTILPSNLIEIFAPIKKTSKISTVDVSILKKYEGKLELRLIELLVSLDLLKYAEIMVKEGITFDLLKELKDSDYLELGLDMESKFRILKTIQ